MLEKLIEHEQQLIDTGNEKNNGRFLIDGKFYRIRRGKLVQIPDEWVSKVPNNNTMNKRKSRKSISRRTRKNKNKST